MSKAKKPDYTAAVRHDQERRAASQQRADDELERHARWDRVEQAWLNIAPTANDWAALGARIAAFCEMLKREDAFEQFLEIEPRSSGEKVAIEIIRIGLIHGEAGIAKAICAAVPTENRGWLDALRGGRLINETLRRIGKPLLHEFVDISEPEASAVLPNAHSQDFRSVNWGGQQFSFTSNQAAVVKALWEAWQNGTPDVGDATLIEIADISSRRLDHIFREHEALGTMIVSGGTRGTHRIAGPMPGS